MSQTHLPPPPHQPNTSGAVDSHTDTHTPSTIEPGDAAANKQFNTPWNAAPGSEQQGAAAAEAAALNEAQEEKKKRKQPQDSRAPAASYNRL